MNVVTKSGSNTFAGNLDEFLRSDKLNANAFFRIRVRIRTQQPPGAAEIQQLRRHRRRPRYYKDKFFFFFSEEARRINRTSTVTGNVPNPTWLTDPTNANYVAPALRDANAVKLLSLYPAPNIGTQQFVSSQAAIQNTRQEVVRVDYELGANHRLTGRYTHDNSFTEEPGGLFQGTQSVPNVVDHGYDRARDRSPRRSCAASSARGR